MERETSNNNFMPEDGFSLVEMLVAITITSILIGFASGIYLFGQRYFLKWRSQLSLQNEFHTLANGITEDLFRADYIESLKTEMLVMKIQGKEKKYSIRNDTLFVNGRNIVSPLLSIVTFKLSAKDEKGNVVMDLKKINDITLVKFTLALANDTDTLVTTRSVHLRKPSNWNILKS